MSPRVDTPRVDTIVRGGKVVTASDIFDAAIAVKGDKIAAIGPEDLLEIQVLLELLKRLLVDFAAAVEPDELGPRGGDCLQH